MASMFIAAVPMIRLFLQKERGAAAKTQLVELIKDQLGLLAALAGIVFIAMGYPIADPIATMVVATIIAINAVGLFRENLSFLLGRAPGPKHLAEIERAARSVPGVLGVHDLCAEMIGPDVVHAGLHIEVARGLPIEEADRIAGEVEARVHQGNQPGYCVIHVDPAPQERKA